MTRRRWLIAQAALVGALALLAFPSSSFALLGTYTISLTPSGASPTAFSVAIDSGYVSFENTDTVTHTISFANGWCSAQIAPGDRFSCGSAPAKVGDYGYTIDGAVQATLSVIPQTRTVTLTATRNGLRLGSKVRLHGSLAIADGSPPAFYGPRMPVTVFARALGEKLWHRIGVVMATPLKTRHYPAHSVWQLWVQPHAGTIYRAEANSQPKAGQFWENARSKPVRSYVRHHRWRSAAAR
jgi:hypothetical protein